jgi:hypothetical protein
MTSYHQFLHRCPQVISNDLLNCYKRQTTLSFNFQEPCRLARESIKRPLGYKIVSNLFDLRRGTFNKCNWFYKLKVINLRFAESGACALRFRCLPPIQWIAGLSPSWIATTFFILWHFCYRNRTRAWFNYGSNVITIYIE